MPKSPRTRRSAAQWQALLKEQQRSGQSQAAFCAAHGLALSNFGYWKRKLRANPQSAAQPDSPEWIELPQLDSKVRTQAPLSGGGWDLELDLGQGLQLRLRHVVS